MDASTRRRIVVALLLIGASLADLPAVYTLVRDASTPAALSLTFGFLAMGLAWAAGFAFEHRRAWFVRFAAAVGALQVVAALAPLGLPRVALLASGALAGAALVVSWQGSEKPA